MKYQLILLLCLFNTSLLFAQVPPGCEPPGTTEPSADYWDACISCGLNAYFGSTAGWAPGSVPQDFCGADPAPQWIGFIAKGSGWSYTITPSNCLQGKGLQAAVYRSPNEPALVCVSGCDTCGNTPLVLQPENMVVGGNYYLLITGNNQDACDFEITNTFPQAQPVPLVPTTPPIQGPDTVCPGAMVTYSIPVLLGAGYYEWNCVNPNVKFNGVSGPVDMLGPDGHSVTVLLPENLPNGTQITISLLPLNSCKIGTQQFKTITIHSLLPTILPKAIICHEDVPYILPWGDSVTTSGTYEYHYSTPSACDSVIRQTVQILPPKISESTKYICAGETVEYCGATFSTPGNHTITCTSFQGCDSIITLHLNVLAPVANILAPDSLHLCGTNAVILKSAASPNSPGVSLKTWKNLTTGQQGTGEIFNATQTGEYVLRTNMSAGGKQCLVTDTVYINFSPQEPALTAEALASNIITCSNPVATLTGVSTDTLSTFVWFTPAGTEIDTNPLTVTQSGTYTLIASSGGCDALINLPVIKDMNTGNTTLSATPVGCNQPAILQAYSSLSQPVFQWISPGGDTLFANPVSTFQTGIYQLIVTNTANGCTETKNVAVAMDTTLFLSQVNLTNADAGQQNGAIDITVTGTPPFTYNWQHNGASFASTEDVSGLEPGFYTVMITGSNGCDTTLLFEITEKTVSTSNLRTENYWKISPNPASGLVLLEWNSPEAQPFTRISCSNVLGYEMKNWQLPSGQNSMQIDYSTLPSGVYLLGFMAKDAVAQQFIRLNILH